MEYILTIRQAKEAVHKIWTGPKALSVVPCLVGEQGVAKSAVYLEVAKELKLTPRQIFIAQSLPEEIVGIVHKDLDRKMMTTLQPEWAANCENTAVILDEVNRGDVATRNAMMQIPLYRKLHLYTFPDSTRCGAAINPDSSMAEGSNGLSKSSTSLSDTASETVKPGRSAYSPFIQCQP